MLAAVGRNGREVEVVHRRPVDRQQDLARDLVAQQVEVGGPAAEIAALHARREPLVGGAVAQRGDRDGVVRPTGAVREPEEVEEARVVVAASVGIQPSRNAASNSSS